MSFYVKLYLSRPNHNPNKKKTSAVKQHAAQRSRSPQPDYDQSPLTTPPAVVFNESFSFKLPLSDIGSANLTVIAMMCAGFARKGRLHIVIL